MSTKIKNPPETREQTGYMALENKIMELERKNRKLNRANKLLRKASTLSDQPPPGFSIQL